MTDSIANIIAYNQVVRFNIIRELFNDGYSFYKIASTATLVALSSGAYALL